MRPEGLCQRKIPMTPSWNRTRDLQASSAVPQPTAPPSAHTFLSDLFISQVGKVEEKCLPIRPSCRWEHNIELDYREERRESVELD